MAQTRRSAPCHSTIPTFVDKGNVSKPSNTQNHHNLTDIQHEVHSISFEIFLIVALKIWFVNQNAPYSPISAIVSFVFFRRKLALR